MSNDPLAVFAATLAFLTGAVLAALLCYVVRATKYPWE